MIRFLTVIIIYIFFNPIHGAHDYDDEEFTHLIVGGYRNKDSTLTKFIVSIRIGEFTISYGDNDICGGAIISKQSVLTAAHCLVDANTNIKTPVNMLYVVAGSKYRLDDKKKTQTLYVKSSIVHPMYSSTGHIADIGILCMIKSFVFDGTTVASIPLATVTPHRNTKCTTGGWGSVYYHGPSPDLILFADLQILSQSACRSLVPHYEIGMICAKNLKAPEMDTCQGDSGGPLICDSILCGVVSFGYDCGDSFPSVYTDVAHYREWIIENSATLANYYLCKLEFIQLLLIILVQNFYN